MKTHQVLYLLTNRLYNLLFAITFLMFFCGNAFSNDGGYHVGLNGDKISIRSGELVLDETDVVVPGKHGLDVVISRHYRSFTYKPEDVDKAHFVLDYNSVNDTSLYTYLGQGWHIEYPYLYRVIDELNADTTLFVVGKDGSMNPVFYNIDTLTDSRFPYKLRTMELMTNFGVDVSTADTLLKTNGTKWIFGHLVDEVKYLTKIINIFGDTLIVTYHTGTKWIKEVTSPLDLGVRFQYGNGDDTTYHMDSIPPNTARLHRLEYESYGNDTSGAPDTLEINYSYKDDATSGYLLEKVFSATGDSTVYSYTAQYKYKNVGNFDYIQYDDTSGWRDTLYFDDATLSTRTSDTVRFISQIITPSGAKVNYTYRWYNTALFPCDTIPEGNFGCYLDYDSCWDYRGYVGVSRRIEDDDTTFFKHEMLWTSLNTTWELPHGVSLKTVVYHPIGAIDEYFFYGEQACSYTPELDPAKGQSHHGFFPDYLYLEQSIRDNDTSAISYDYNHSTAKIKIAETRKTTVDTTTGDTTFFIGEIWGVNEMLKHVGVGYYKPDWILDSAVYYIDVSPKEKFTSYSKQDLFAGGITLVSLVRERRDVDKVCDSLIGGDPDSIYYCKNWKLHHETVSPFPTDSFSFTKDSVVDYEYIPSLNKTIIKKTYRVTQKDTLVVASFREYEYDTAQFYQVSKITKYLDTTYIDTTYASSTDTLVRKYEYDSLGNLVKSFNIIGDSTLYEYDTLYNAFLWKKTVPVIGLVVTNEYYKDGKLKSRKDANGAETIVRYDSLGRQHSVILPLETDFSFKEEVNTDSLFRDKTIKIDSGLEIKERSYLDKHLRTVKRVLEVNDSVNIVDSTVYGDNGFASKTLRARYDNDTLSDSVWTEFTYDQHLRLIKTLYPDSTNDTTIIVDHFTTDFVSARGNKVRTIRDYEGNVITRITYDTSGTALDTFNYEFGKFNRVVSYTDLKGLTHEYEYDDFGRRIKITHPDVGTIKTWYNQQNQKRFVERNSADTNTYFIYDRIGRLVEEGTIVNPDTTKVDSLTYPDSSVTKKVWAEYRYDSYSDSSRAADTSGGNGYSIGRLTEIDDSSGFRIFYYDARGRVTKATTYILGMTDTNLVSYDFFANNALKRIDMPVDSHYTEYSYDRVGRIRTISGVIEEDSISYEAWGAITSIDFTKNGINKRNKYDIMGRPTEVLNYTSIRNMFSRGYSYDNGFMDLETSITKDSLGQFTLHDTIRTYTYDERDRLITADIEDPWGAAAARTIDYAYDENHNLDYKYISGLDTTFYTHFDSSNADSILTFGTDSSYVYTRNDLGLVTAIEKYNVPYPGPSDTMWNHKIEYTYDYRNLLTMAIYRDYVYFIGQGDDTVKNYYNSTGQKVKQTFTYQLNIGLKFGRKFPRSNWDTVTVSRYYFWSGNKVLMESTNDSTITEVNIYGLGQRLGKKLLLYAADSLNIYVNDFYGSVRTFVRATGTPRDEKIEYYPYGAIYSIAGNSFQHHRFLGKEDDYTDELDFGPRYYAELHGRFLAPDPILSGASPYSYTAGNPVMQYDPSGLDAMNWTNPYYRPGRRFVGPGINNSSLVEQARALLIRAVLRAGGVNAYLYEKWKREQRDPASISTSNGLTSISFGPMEDLIARLLYTQLDDKITVEAERPSEPFTPSWLDDPNFGYGSGGFGGGGYWGGSGNWAGGGSGSGSWGGTGNWAGGGSSNSGRNWLWGTTRTVTTYRPQDIRIASIDPPYGQLEALGYVVGIELMISGGELLVAGGTIVMITAPITGGPYAPAQYGVGVGMALGGGVLISYGFSLFIEHYPRMIDAL